VTLSIFVDGTHFTIIFLVFFVYIKPRTSHPIHN